MQYSAGSSAQLLLDDLTLDPWTEEPYRNTSSVLPKGDYRSWGYTSPTQVPLVAESTPHLASASALVSVGSDGGASYLDRRHDLPDPSFRQRLGNAYRRNPRVFQAAGAGAVVALGIAGLTAFNRNRIAEQQQQDAFAAAQDPVPGLPSTPSPEF